MSDAARRRARRPAARAASGTVRPFRSGHTCEALEGRRLLAATPQLVRDINAANGSSALHDLTAVGDALYFALEHPAGAGGGEGLWKTDGTAAGTVLVKDFAAPAYGRVLDGLTDVGGRLFFFARDSSNQPHLWTTDGTPAGTAEVAAFRSDAFFETPAPAPVSVGGTLYFAAQSAADGRPYLFRSDGTPGGTVPVGPALAAGLAAAGDAVYFTDVTAGLYRSDGTPAGTALVSGGPANGADLTAAGTRVFFTAGDALWMGTSARRELWASDGTPDGTVPVFPQVSNPDWSPRDLTNVNGVLYFSAGDDLAGRELWRSDGTPAGTARVRDIAPGPTGSAPAGLAVAGGTLYFAATDPAGGSELWRSDGTADGTGRVADLNPGPAGSSPGDLTPVGGTLYFTATTAAGGTELWRTDGTAAGTVQVADVAPGADGSAPGHLVGAGWTTYFAANDGVHGRELWRTDGTAAGTRLVSDLNTVATSAVISSNPSDLTDVGGTLYFAATDTLAGRELWRTDGTAAGTERVADVYPGPQGSNPDHLTRVGGLLYFTTGSPELTPLLGLWRTDGTAAGTVHLTDLTPNASKNGSSEFLAVGDTLYFCTADQGLWRSDGTVSGTGPVAPRRGGVGGVQATGLAALGGIVYFAGFTPAGGSELWRSDGTARGTRRVADIVPGSQSSAPAGLTAFGGSLYFAAYGPAGDRELWRTDGTADGTVCVRDVATGPGASSSPDLLTVAGGLLYFRAYIDSGTSLWRTDGTEAGTASVARAPVEELTAVNGALFYEAFGFLYRCELPASGPRKVGPALNPANLLDVNGTLYFTAYDRAGGRDLWRSDGTPAGTVRAADLNIGVAAPAVPTDLRVAGGRLFFPSDDGARGAELWRFDLPPAVTSLAVAGGSAQRSRVRQLTVAFDRPVALAAGALALERANTGGSGADDGSVPTDASAALGAPYSGDGGVSWTVPVLAGTAFSDASGSLADGVYTLRVRGDRVTDAGGDTMFAERALAFHRLFGDQDGNGTVNNADYVRFRSAFGSSAGDPGYSALFDHDGNGVINNADYLPFRNRFGTAFAV